MTTHPGTHHAKFPQPTCAPPEWTLEHDLAMVLDAARDVFASLRGARLFITGGTGFIGCWLLETLRHAITVLNLDIRATILTRAPDRFRDRWPHLAAVPAFDFVQGDVRTFAWPAGEYSHLIHAATDALAGLNQDDPALMFDIILQGTRRALDFAAAKKAGRVLYLSSGAVYGCQPPDLTHIPEDWRGAPDCTNPANTYAEAKRAAEMLCAIHGKQFAVPVSIARIFALLGPYLPLGVHFAAGNFIRDAIEGRKITVRGSGQPVRSYLYAADLTVMLWHLLVRGAAGRAYNVGSDEEISIADLARKTAGLTGRAGVEIQAQPDAGWNQGRYVPDTRLIGRDLGLYKTVSLDDAIRRTALWHGWKP